MPHASPRQDANPRQQEATRTSDIGIKVFAYPLTADVGIDPAKSAKLLSSEGIPVAAASPERDNRPQF
jgi:hypothetical protein